MKRFLPGLLALSLPLLATAVDHPGITAAGHAPGRFSLIRDGVPAAVSKEPGGLSGV